MKRGMEIQEEGMIRNSFYGDDEKTEKNRERNREHARKTRQRKKEMIEGTKGRLIEAHREAMKLQQLLEESSTANILLCLGKDGSAAEKPDHLTLSLNWASSAKEVEEIKAVRALIMKGNIVDQLRQQVRMEAAKVWKKHLSSSTSPVHSHPESDATTSSTTTTIEARSSSSGEEEEDDGKDHHVMISDEEEQGMHSDEEFNHKSPATDEAQKRERNRMHAKLTRDRKKLFTLKMQQTIQLLERNNQLMHRQLEHIMTESNTIRSTQSNHPPPLTVGSFPLVPKAVKARGKAVTGSSIYPYPTQALLPTHPYFGAYDNNLSNHALLMQSAFAPFIPGMNPYTNGTAFWPLFPSVSMEKNMGSSSQPPKKKLKTLH